jgi:DNA-directed RNA polymerase subunit RPC12/RpoP
VSGRTIGDRDGVRQFPCSRCGAKVEFAPGTDSLECPYCGQRTAIPAGEALIEEQDFLSVTAADLGADGETEEVTSVQCQSCGALVEPSPHHEAFPCPYCGSSIVTTEKSQRLIKPQALLSFRIERARATELFRTWIGRLWFAPNALKKLARIDGRLQGLYAPYWTYDADTISRYSGQRGDNYTVTRTRTVVRGGKTVRETYQAVEIRWRPASGTVSRDFDDVLVVGSSSLPRDLAEELEPWDLENLAPYTDEYLSGFLAERYQVDVKSGWVRARERMESVIRQDVNRDIGGDHQRIHSLRTDHSAVTFKHVLLPMWICSYRYRSEIYRFLVNARTGEVQGQRPWSWVKITLTALLVAGVAFALYMYFEGR